MTDKTIKRLLWVIVVLLFLHILALLQPYEVVTVRILDNDRIFVVNKYTHTAYLVRAVQ